MKCFRRYCSALCVCLLLLGGFSINVSAASSNVPAYTVTSAVTVSGVVSNYEELTFTPNNTGDREVTIVYGHATYDSTEKLTVNTVWTFKAINNQPLISKGGSVDWQLQKTAYSILHQKSATATNYDTMANSVRLLLFYADGTMQYVDNVKQVNDSSLRFNSNFSATFTPKADVVKVEVQLFDTIPLGDYTIYVGEYDGSKDGWHFIVEQESKEAGLLGGLLEWIKNIFNSITNFFSGMFDKLDSLTGSIGDWFSNLVDNITELPAKIWQFISDGLKSLFVPSEEFIVDFKEDIDGLLAEKLGAVYQVIDITFESWDRITDSDTTNTIQMPQATINLPNNNKFTFGGFTVQVVPNGFDMLVTAIKTIVGILCTISFINGLRKRYDEIMGGGQ